MTLADLQTLTLSWLDDVNAGYFTLPQLNVFINNAQKEVQKRLIKAGQNYYVRFFQTNLVINQRDYVLPMDFKKIHRLEIVMSGVAPNEALSVVGPMTLNQQDLIMGGNGTPAFYFIKKGRLVVKPAPDTALVMRMYYTPQLTDLVNLVDTPDVPEDYHELIALLAAQDGFLKDGRSSELLVKKLAEYERDLDNDANERQQDLPRSIVDTGNENSSGFYW